MEIATEELYPISPQEEVFRLEELLTLILEYATPTREKQDLLRYRAVGRVWDKCASRMFKEPPLKIWLDMKVMLYYREMYHSETFIPMEVTVEGWLSRRKLDFLIQHSVNVEILHFVGVEGVQEMANNPPELPKLKTITVNNQFEVYYQPGKMFDFINNLAKLAPKLNAFKVIYNDGVTRHFQESLEGYVLPDLMTELKAVNIRTCFFKHVLAKSNLTNLSAVELNLRNFKSGFKIICGALAFLVDFRGSRLKKLKLEFEPRQNEFVWIYPLQYLEEFETNVSIMTIKRTVPISKLLPKLKRLTCTGGVSRTLSTLLLEGSNYENLEILTLHGPSFFGQTRTNEPGAASIQLGLLATIKQLKFPAFPKLTSLTWRGFSLPFTNAVVPRIFANSKHISELDIGVEELLALCRHFHSDENLLAGTNFNRLKTLSIDAESRDEFNIRLLYSPISIALPYLETIKLGENISINAGTKMQWELSGRTMIVDPTQVTECTWPDAEAVYAMDPFGLKLTDS